MSENAFLFVGFVFGILSSMFLDLLIKWTDKKNKEKEKD